MMNFVQLREFIREYNRITEICFADCVNDFTARSVSTSEVNDRKIYFTRRKKMIENVSIDFSTRAPRIA